MTKIQCLYCDQEIAIGQPHAEEEIACPACGDRQPMRALSPARTAVSAPLSDRVDEELELVPRRDRHDLARDGTPHEDHWDPVVNDRLFEALMSGATVTMAAHMAGISRRTAYRRLEDTVFRNRLDQARVAVRQNIVQRLIDACGAAVDCLWELLEDEDPMIRMHASKTLLNTLARIDRPTERPREIRSRETRMQIVKQETNETVQA